MQVKEWMNVTIYLLLLKTIQYVPRLFISCTVRQQFQFRYIQLCNCFIIRSTLSCRCKLYRFYLFNIVQKISKLSIGINIYFAF